MSAPARESSATVMVVLGSVFVVLGGLTAAVTGPWEWAQGSWLAAYLVLVCGVAQFAIGIVQAAGATAPAPAARAWAQVVCLNLGNLGVVLGTLTRTPWLVDVSGVLLMVAFGLALYAARPHRGHGGRGVAGLSATGAAHRSLIWAYRFLLVVLVVSLPIGSVLAHLRA